MNKMLQCISIQLPSSYNHFDRPQKETNTVEVECTLLRGTLSLWITHKTLWKSYFTQHSSNSNFPQELHLSAKKINNSVNNYTLSHSLRLAENKSRFILFYHCQKCFLRPWNVFPIWLSGNCSLGYCYC